MIEPTEFLDVFSIEKFNQQAAFRAKKKGRISIVRPVGIKNK